MRRFQTSFLNTRALANCPLFNVIFSWRATFSSSFYFIYFFHTKYKFHTLITGAQSAQWEKRAKFGRESHQCQHTRERKMKFKVGICQLKLWEGLWRFDRTQLQKCPLVGFGIWYFYVAVSFKSKPTAVSPTPLWSMGDIPFLLLL